MKTLPLGDAIILEVNTFVKANEPFSIHQITTNIRNKVNNGEYNIPDIIVFGMPFKYRVEHADVKSLFKTLQFHKALPELDAEPNGMYIEYTPVITKKAVSAKKAAQAPLVDTSEARRRIKNYLDSHMVSFPTMKKIQSAIKRKSQATGLACRDIYALVDMLGYTVNTSRNHISKWFVE